MTTLTLSDGQIIDVAQITKAVFARNYLRVEMGGVMVTLFAQSNPLPFPLLPSGMVHIQAEISLAYYFSSIRLMRLLVRGFQEFFFPAELYSLNYRQEHG